MREEAVVNGNRVHRVLAALSVALVAGVVHGCASTPGAPPLDNPIVDITTVKTKDVLGEADDRAPATNPPQNPPQAAFDYRIGAGDLLFFRSFDDPNLTMTVPVRYDGHISLQVIPDIKVAGLTREEAEELVREAYSEYYLEPELTLSVSEVGSKSYTVMGEVMQPAQYPYTKPISLLGAINIAGGIRVNRQSDDSFIGNQGQLVGALLIRGKGEERKVYDVNLRDFDKPGASLADTPVLPDVAQPRVYAISEDLTLIRLLALAGGYRDFTAKLTKVVVTREISEAESQIILVDVKEAMRTGRDFRLEPGDIIYVPKRGLVKAEEALTRAFAPASRVMSFAQQVMNLYQAAFDTWFTDDRFDLLFDDDQQGNLLIDSALTLQRFTDSVTQLVPPTN